MERDKDALETGGWRCDRASPLREGTICEEYQEEEETDLQKAWITNFRFRSSSHSVVLAASEDQVPKNAGAMNVPGTSDRGELSCRC